MVITVAAFRLFTLCSGWDGGGGRRVEEHVNDPPPIPGTPTSWVPWSCHSFAQAPPLLRAAFPTPRQFDHHPTGVDPPFPSFTSPTLGSQAPAVEGCISLALVTLISYRPPTCPGAGHCALCFHVFSCTSVLAAMLRMGLMG